jgi:hypothetical protein
MSQTDPRVVMLSALVTKFCDSRTEHAALDAQLVFHHLESLDREDKIARLERQIDRIDQFDREFVRYLQKRPIAWGMIEQLASHFIKGAVCVEDVRPFAHLLEGQNEFKEMRAGAMTLEQVDRFVAWMNAYRAVLVGVLEREDKLRDMAMGRTKFDNVPDASDAEPENRQMALGPIGEGAPGESPDC